MAPAPRLRDRHLHDRRRHGPPGQPRWRRLDHQRRHPVDDRRLRDAAHRDPAGVAGRLRRAVPRRPAVGEPAARPEVGRPRATRTCAPASSGWSPPPTPARWCGSSPARSAATTGPGSTHTPMAMVHGTLAPGRAPRPAVAGRLQRAGLRAGRRPAPSAPSAARCTRASSPCSGRGDFVAVGRRRPPGRPHRRRSTCWSSAAARSASRSPGAGRS